MLHASRPMRGTLITVGNFFPFHRATYGPSNRRPFHRATYDTAQGPSFRYLRRLALFIVSINVKPQALRQVLPGFSYVSS